MGQKVFVMAWDGSTLDLIEPWIEAGLLPNLGRVFKQGAWGRLRSTVPPITPVAWLSFSTGRNPGQHGVFDFFRPLRQNYAELIPTTATISHEPTLWSRLSRLGRKSIVVNVPMTYPAEKIDGIVISGPPSPTNDNRSAHPHSILEELREHGWDLTLDATSVHGAFDKYLHFLCELIGHRTAAALYLMEKYPWDFFMVHYLETDQAQHSYWRFLNDGSSKAAGMLKVHQAADVALGQIIDRLTPDVNMIILSDHGMGPTNYHVHLNNWLIKHEFMVWRRHPSTLIRRMLYGIGLDPTSVYNRLPRLLVRRMSLGEMRAGVAQVNASVLRHSPTLWDRVKKTILRAPFLNFSDVNWHRTVAYSFGSTQVGMIYLNVKGRESQGVVEMSKDYEHIRMSIAAELLKLIDPYSGEPLVRHVLKREEVYNGINVEYAPDLIALYRTGDYDSKKGTVFMSKRIVDRVPDANATHRPLGMVALIGPQIKVGHHMPEVDILDVPSTVFALMGEPIPAEFEGRVLQDALLNEIDFNVVSYPKAAFSQQVNMSGEELAQVMDKLRALGYID